MIEYVEIDQTDRDLIRAACEVIERNYTEKRHTVGAAVLCSSGKIHVGVNVDCSGYGPCAEPVAIGCAISDGERRIERIVAVGGPAEPHNVMSPCGNCRQLILDYAKDCWVILTHENKVVKVRIKELIPNAYNSSKLERPTGVP